MSDNLRQQIEEALRQALGKTGHEAFLESQRVVPVVTGNLKSSGSFVEGATEIALKYAAEYSSVVERGWSGGMVWTNSFTKRDGTIVKGHYKNQPPREGKHFIENSMKNVFKGREGSKSAFQSNFLEKLRDAVSPYNVTEL